jgi:hypothetical protein
MIDDLQTKLFAEMNSINCKLQMKEFTTDEGKKVMIVKIVDKFKDGAKRG